MALAGQLVLRRPGGARTIPRRCGLHRQQPAGSLLQGAAAGARRSRRRSRSPPTSATSIAARRRPTAGWAASAWRNRVSWTSWLATTVRGDIFYDQRGRSCSSSRSAIPIICRRAAPYLLGGVSITNDCVAEPVGAVPPRVLAPRGRTSPTSAATAASPARRAFRVRSCRASRPTCAGATTGSIFNATLRLIAPNRRVRFSTNGRFGDSAAAGGVDSGGRCRRCTLEDPEVGRLVADDAEVPAVARLLHHRRRVAAHQHRLAGLERRGDRRARSGAGSRRWCRGRSPTWP